jgi:hypothetical protein
MNTYRDEDDEIFTEADMRNQWAEDIASMDPKASTCRNSTPSRAGWPTC